MKTFTKTYYEIRYNFEDSYYFPKFDEYNLAQMIDLIALLTEHKEEVLATWEPDSIIEAFGKVTGKEVAQLEKDMLEVFS